MGIETEFGISVPGHPHVNAMTTSSAVVTSYTGIAVGDRRGRARWDFEEENPLRDARGFDMSRAEADPSQLTDEELGLANLILTNGARLYVDHAHPEYSTPEVTNPRDAVLWDRAGQQIMAEAAAAATREGPFTIQLYKNNTDNKGASYGTHENYLMRRATPFSDIVRDLTPFFVTRQVFTGAGRVGIGQDGRGAGFQLSQRADFFEVEVGLETTLKRPIINTVPFSEIRIVYLRIPNSGFVELLEYRGVERHSASARPADFGGGHLCLYVDDIEAISARMQKLGYSSRSDRPVDIVAGPNIGAKVIYMIDPDGYFIELFQKPIKS